MYATIADVQGAMPQFVLTETSKPNLAQAQVFLDATHAQFDAAMANIGYVVPISGPNSKLQAQAIVVQGAICKILSSRGSAIGTEVAFQSADRACKVYTDSLMALADPNNPLSLSDSPVTGDFTEKDTQSSPMGGFSELGINAPPRCTMTQKW